MIVLKIVGGLLVLWGIADVGGSYMGIDVWRDWLGIELSGLAYRFSGYAELISGALLWSVGGKQDDEQAE